MEKRYTKPEKYIGLGVWCCSENGPVKKKVKWVNIKYTEDGWEPLYFTLEDDQVVPGDVVHSSKRGAVLAYRKSVEEKKKDALHLLESCSKELDFAKRMCSGADRRREIKEWLERVNSKLPEGCPKFKKCKDTYISELTSGRLIEARPLNSYSLTWYVLWDRRDEYDSRLTIADSVHLSGLYAAGMREVPYDHMQM